MFKFTAHVFVAAALAALTACAPLDGDTGSSMAAPVDPADPIDSIESAVTGYPNSTFFIVTGRDLRRCAYPLCGGVFAQRVNRGNAVCSDGTTQTQCRILEIDYSALKLDAATQDKLDSYVQAGQALVRGSIKKTKPIAGHTYDRLAVLDAWVGRALATPTGSFSRARELPLACAACPAFPLEPLNSTAMPTSVHAVIFDPARFSTPLASELQAALSAQPAGVLVAGTRGAMGTRQILTVSEAYTPFPAYKPRVGKLGELCGSRGIPADCDTGLFCLRTPDANCGRADAAGTCSVQPAICTKEYRPVCGCDGNTYGNTCSAHAAGVSVDYDGECKP